MKKVVLIFFTTFIYAQTTLAQNNLSEIEKLAYTAKIWGFLKYYHPKVAAGKFDWDNQLFKILPKVKKSRSKEELSDVYIDWIGNLGEVKKCKKCEQESEKEYFDKNFDLNWINNDQVFTTELVEKLRFIEQNRHQGKKYYVTTKGKREDLAIANETTFHSLDWTSKQLRLLSLFRYWNIIEYFYPHKYLIDDDWDKVLFQMIPKFSSPKTELELHLAMLELVVKIDDSHGYFFTPLTNEYFGEKFIPAAFKIIDEKVVITHYYNDSLSLLNDIKVGDIITRIDGKKTGETLRDVLKYINGSNHSAKLKYAYSKILNGSTDSVKVEIYRDSKKEDRIWTRYKFEQFRYKPKGEMWQELANNIGYINLGVIKEKELIETLDELIGMKAVILDLRNYPNGSFRYILRNHFGAKNPLTCRQSKPDLSYPGRFILSDQKSGSKIIESKFKGEVILLVNEKTQSQAEYIAMWIQNAHKVTTIGSQTAGAGGMMTLQKFAEGHNSYFTSSGIFYPDMTPIQRKGVKIDIEVKPTIKGIVEGRDEVLEKAIELIDQ